MSEQDRVQGVLAYVLHRHHRGYQIEPPCETCKTQAAVTVNSRDIDVTLPPEPEWRPGQYVMLSVTEESDQRLLARRNRLNDGWELIGVEPIYRDDEVTDVEPAVVLTAEDAKWLAMDASVGEALAFFAERGVDVR